ncbi:MAG: DUF4272 domain-containing protein [Planctomycetes bacterium]|nr:DUF4272 domain-containing protein [Planctomycetota bacterium]
MADHPDPDDEHEARPPSGPEVARRALVLAVVSCRGSLENDPDRAGAAAFWERVLLWWRSVEIDSSLESAEADLLSATFGELPGQSSVNASWRAEALVVLAWALRRRDIPPHDIQADPRATASALGFLQPTTVLKAPELRSIDELNAYKDVAFTVHWRLREFSLRHTAMDFQALCKASWFGPFSLSGVQILENDLAVAGKPLAFASAASVRLATSIASERHQAANWLADATVPFSETDTST